MSTISRDYLSLASRPIAPTFNFSTRRIGGLRFVKIGRFCVSFCVTKEYNPL